MDNVKVVHLCGTEKWMNLLHWMNNAVPHVFCVKCRDEREAKSTAHRIQDVITGHPTWFEMFVVRRKAEVYVIKMRFAQKVVIKRE